MKIFKDRLTPWWETGMIKWSAFLIGIAVGAYWSELFRPYAVDLVVVGIVLGIIAAVVWAKE